MTNLSNTYLKRKLYRLAYSILEDEALTEDCLKIVSDLIVKDAESLMALPTEDFFLLAYNLTKRTAIGLRRKQERI
ncbi:MAG: hypothetical protein HFE73_08850 [Firmicutes bacterium]|nr:hypothetical protein [Bacillota bacterium]